MNYSIIIPHYNSPKLLARCLKSIPKRSDTEIIVVDDKSPESCISALKELEGKMPHIKFIYNQQNGGGGKARNTGLQVATGKYLCLLEKVPFSKAPKFLLSFCYIQTLWLPRKDEIQS